MTQKTSDERDDEQTAGFPACCKDFAEKMGCGAMLEEMMSRFGAKTVDRGCCGRDESPEQR